MSETRREIMDVVTSSSDLPEAHFHAALDSNSRKSVNRSSEAIIPKKIRLEDANPEYFQTLVQGTYASCFISALYASITNTETLQPKVLSESYCPLRDTSAPVRKLDLPLTMKSETQVFPADSPAFSVWSTQPKTVFEVHESTEELAETSGKAHRQLNLNVSFDDHLERLKTFLHGPKRLKANSSHENYSAQASADISFCCGPQGDLADEVSRCLSPLNLKVTSSARHTKNVADKAEVRKMQKKNPKLRKTDTKTNVVKKMTSSNNLSQTHLLSKSLWPTARQLSMLSYNSMMCSSPTGFPAREAFFSHPLLLCPQPQPYSGLSHTKRISNAAAYLSVEQVQQEQQPKAIRVPGVESPSLNPPLDQGQVEKPASMSKMALVKKYKCDVCDKTFSRSNTLVTHKRIHTGDKPFKCERCGRAFRQPGNLTRHRLTHTAHKPYLCSQCGKAFNRASNLTTHMRTHNGCVRPAFCGVCHEQFDHKCNLRLHELSHAGPSLPVCTCT